MNKLKENFEFVIGFIAIIISVSAFKDELEKIKIHLSFYDLNLAQFFFGLIIGYLIVLQLYVIPVILLNKYPESKLLKFIGTTSYTLFIILVFSPIILFIIYLIDFLINLIPPFSDTTKEKFSFIISIIISTISSIIASFLVRFFRKEKRKQQIEVLENDEVIDLESSMKLARDGYYAQAILELAKAIEKRLIKALFLKGVEISRRNLLELLRESKKHEILNDSEISSIDALRVLRNKVVHESDIDIDKASFQKYLIIVKSIIEKTNNMTSLRNDMTNQFFKGTTFDNFASAQIESKRLNKPIFMIIYDGLHPQKSRLEWALGYFMQYDTTKKLVEDNFVQVITDKTKENVAKYIPKDDPLETCLLVVIFNDKIIKQETVYANMDEGLKRVREIIKILNTFTE